MKLDLKVHHIGCVVESITESIKTYTEKLGFTECSEVFEIKSQEVKVCFVEIGNGTHIEFVEPLNADSSIAKLLKKRQSYYHIGYLVHDFDNTLRDLEKKGLKALPSFKSEAFNNNRCVFLFTDEMHFIELIETN